MKLLKKIWKDPVGSNIIADIIKIILLTLLTIIWSSIDAQLKNIDFKTAWINFWTLKIELWIIFVGIIFFLIIYWLNKRFKSKKFRYNENTLKLDRELFNKIREELLPQNTVIYFLRHKNFAGWSFDLDYIEYLHKFEDENENPDFSFFHPTLENLKSELFNKISHFTEIIAYHTFPTKTGKNINEVPSEWADEQPERYQKVVSDLHKTKDEICSKYDELIKTGRELLQI